MLRNKKGMVEVVAVVGIAAIALVTWLVGPQLVKSIGTWTNGGDKNQSKAVHSIKSERTLYQVDPQHPDKLIPVKEKYEEISNQTDSERPPETLWEKFWHMGVMAVAIIVALAYLGILPVIRLWWSKKIKPKIDQAISDMESAQAAHDELSTDARKIVLSVDEGLGTMDANIKAAQTMADATTDVNVKNSYTTIVLALQDMKSDFLAAMSKKQDSTTKLLVRELKND